MSFDNRMRCLAGLKEIGFQVGCGFMVGSPFQTPHTLAKDLKFVEKEDNDTPDQSPSERENVAGNEVGQRIGEIPVESVRRRSLGASRSRG